MSFMVLFPAWSPGRDSPADSSMKSLGHSLLLVNPGRRVLHDDDDDDDDDDDVGRMRVILAETACCNFAIF